MGSQSGMTRTRSTGWRLAATAAAVLLAGCAAPAGRTATGPSASGLAPTTGPSGSQPAPQVDDARLTGSLGWAAVGDRLYLTADEGATWRPLALPARPARGHAVAVLDPQTILSLGTAGGDVVASVTRDGARTWQSQAVGATGPIGSVDVSAQSASRVSVLVTGVTGANFSVGTFFRTRDGRTWTRTAAPAGGQIAVGPGGAVWLAGGGQGGHLYRSQDGGGSWARVGIPVTDLPTGGTVTFAPPRLFAGGGVVVPVTVHAVDGATQVRFYVSRDDGRSWSLGGRQALEASTGAGVPVPTAVVDLGTWVVAEPDGTRVYTLGAQGPAQVRSPNGLPAGVRSLSFVSASLGWAFAVTSSCASGKLGCSERSGLFRTQDGGQTWRSVTPR